MRVKRKMQSIKTLFRGGVVAGITAKLRFGEWARSGAGINDGNNCWVSADRIKCWDAGGTWRIGMAR